VYRLGPLLCVPLLLVSLASAGDEEKKPQKKPPIDKKKIPPPVLTHVVGTVEMKDGTIFLARFRMADEVVIRTPNLRSLTMKLAVVRFLDMESELHRIITHSPETFYGLIQNESFTVQVLATNSMLEIPRTGIKRFVLPDLPQQEVMP
jgi:hypothetical protein